MVRADQFEKLVGTTKKNWHITLSQNATHHLVGALLTHVRDSELFVYAISTFVRITQEQKPPTASFVINGDRCLLLVGLFPESIIRRGLLVQSYVSMGKEYYAQARTHEPKALRQYYESIIAEFGTMAHTLQVMRSA